MNHLSTRRLAITLLTPSAALCAGTAAAATLLVGPNQAISSIAEAARLAKDGDTVAIMPGTYKGDVALWLQKSLTIRGVGERPVLDADGKSAEGKAIWVFRNGDFSVENIEFRNARVRDGNGAGIRFERGALTVRDCVFIDNQMGLLTANFRKARLAVRDSLFASAPHTDGVLHHLLYVGRIDRFELEGSRLHGGFRGHLVKSRARESEIRYNLIYDGGGGTASYEVEFPNGGDALLIGNTIGQSADSENPVVVAYGAEGAAWGVNRLLMSHNTLLNKGWRPAWFARVWQNRIEGGAEVVTRNNLTVGLGAFTLALPGDHAGNYPLPGGALDGDTLDFTLAPDSWLRGRVDRPDGAFGERMTPKAEFRLPVGTVPLVAPVEWAPGAFQSPLPPVRLPVLSHGGTPPAAAQAERDP